MSKTILIIFSLGYRVISCMKQMSRCDKIAEGHNGKNSLFVSTAGMNFVVF